MSITIIEGFKIYKNSNRLSIIINSNCIDECMRIYREHHLDGVAITTSHDYKLQNVDFLAEYPNIKHLSISDNIEDIKAVHKLPNLESFILSGKNRKIDFLNLPNLVELIIDWSPSFLNLNSCIHLKRLSVYKYNPKTKDCSDISSTPWVKRLNITQSPIITLSRLEKFNQLQELTINYCSKLETLCCLEKSEQTLTSLIFDHCKSIRNHEYVIRFKQLSTLAFNDGGVIPSIQFIKEMASLKDFRFVGTDITDGDITPCKGLTNAAFSKKKYYFYTTEQMKTFKKG